MPPHKQQRVDRSSWTQILQLKPAPPSTQVGGPTSLRQARRELKVCPGRTRPRRLIDHQTSALRGVRNEAGPDHSRHLRVHRKAARSLPPRLGRIGHARRTGVVAATSVDDAQRQRGCHGVEVVVHLWWAFGRAGRLRGTNEAPRIFEVLVESRHGQHGPAVVLIGGSATTLPVQLLVSSSVSGWKLARLTPRFSFIVMCFREGDHAWNYEQWSRSGGIKL